MSDFPSIGEMRHRLILEAPVDTPDDGGGFVRGYRPVASIWGQSRSTDATLQFPQQKLEQSTTHRVIIRWRPDVSNEMRFDLLGRKLTIRAVIDLQERRRFLLCDCEEFS